MFAPRLIGNRRFVSALSAVALVAAVFSAGRAVASVTVLTGGDPGEGFSPKPAVYAAEDFLTNVGQPALTVQGVTFDTNAGAISPAGGIPVGTSLPTWNVTTNDVNLATVIQGLIVTGGGVASTVTGLTPGIRYQFDVFISDYGTSDRTQNVEFLDDSTPTPNVLLAEPDFAALTSVQGYDVADVLIAPSDGTVTVLATDGVAVMNALAVTFMVPEPASLGLLSVGGLMLLRRRRA